VVDVGVGRGEMSEFEQTKTRDDAMRDALIDLYKRLGSVEKRASLDKFRSIYDGLAGLTKRIEKLEHRPGAKALCSRCGHRFDECTCYADLQARVDEFVAWVGSWSRLGAASSMDSMTSHHVEQIMNKLRKLGMVE
jgi:hypothetical protein